MILRAAIISLLLGDPMTPNMGLTEPQPGTTPGPTYASELTNDLPIIDVHDHTPGKGVKVPTAGININADLNHNGNGAIGIGTAQALAVYADSGVFNQITADGGFFGALTVQGAANDQGTFSADAGVFNAIFSDAGTFNQVAADAGSFNAISADAGWFDLTLSSNASGTTPGTFGTFSGATGYIGLWPTLPAGMSLSNFLILGNGAASYFNVTNVGGDIFLEAHNAHSADLHDFANGMEWEGLAVAGVSSGDAGSFNSLYSDAGLFNQVNADAGQFDFLDAGGLGAASITVAPSGSAPMTIASGSISQTGPTDLNLNVASGRVVLAPSTYINASALFDGGEIDATGQLKTPFVDAGSVETAGAALYDISGLQGPEVKVLTADAGYTVNGNCQTGNGDTLCVDEIVNSQQTRTRGDIFNVDNNGALRFGIGYSGHVVTGGGVPTTPVAGNFNACYGAVAAISILNGNDTCFQLQFTTGATTNTCAVNAVLITGGIALGNAYSSVAFNCMASFLSPPGTAAELGNLYCFETAAGTIGLRPTTSFVPVGSTTYSYQICTFGAGAAY